MKSLIGIFMVLLMIAISCTSSEKVIETPQLTDYMDTVSYSVGVDIGKSFRLFNRNKNSRRNLPFTTLP
jgi:hypothetical protein